MIRRQQGVTEHLAANAPAGAGSSWFSIGPREVNGRIKALAVHPTIPDIVCTFSASGGVWTGGGGAQSWHPLWDDQNAMASAAITIALRAPNTLYVGTGEWPRDAVQASLTQASSLALMAARHGRSGQPPSLDVLLKSLSRPRNQTAPTWLADLARCHLSALLLSRRSRLGEAIGAIHDSSVPNDAQADS